MYETRVFDGRALRCAGVAALLAGCTSGRITWDDGTDVLRTAIYKETSSNGVHSAGLLLSNSSFGCALPKSDDPSVAAQEIAALLAAACREGARHVNIRLFRVGGGDWTGSYPGVDTASVAALTDGQPRLADAVYYGVDEAFLVDLGVVRRAYAAQDDALDLDAADGGVVEIRRDGDRLVGEFAFPRGSLQGTFRATLCEGDTSLLDFLEPSPSHLCP